MRILALDLGTKCGWAISPLESGVLDLSRKRFEGGGMIFFRFRENLNRLLDSGVDLVCYEEVRKHLGVDASHMYGGLQAVLTSECEARSIPYTGVPVSHIKRHATGSGGAKKDKMIAAAVAKWPEVKIEGHDHADALWLLDLAIQEYSK